MDSVFLLSDCEWQAHTKDGDGSGKLLPCVVTPKMLSLSYTL